MENRIKVIINQIKSKLNIKESFTKADSGTRSQVYLSDNYVLKINKNFDLLAGESKMLKLIKNEKIPQAFSLISVDNLIVLVEKRLPGKPLDGVWKNISERGKDFLISDLVQLIEAVHRKTSDKFYSAQFHKNFLSYGELLFSHRSQYISVIQQNPIAYQKFRAVEKNLDPSHIDKVFFRTKPTFLHGDLIMHNILVEKDRFSGLIDWEFSQFGDPFYDLARVIYYQECARDYLENQEDHYYEYDFTSRLINTMEKQIPFEEDKYRIIRSFYFVDTMIWALKQKDPKTELSNLIVPELN